MSDLNNTPEPNAIEAAYRNGRSAGLATAALAASVVAWFNLFGVEKSSLAIVLALLAVKGWKPLAATARRSRIALTIAALNFATIVGVLVVFHAQIFEIFQKLTEVIRLLHKVS
jgi:hypothetical protein